MRHSTLFRGVFNNFLSAWLHDDTGGGAAEGQADGDHRGPALLSALLLAPGPPLCGVACAEILALGTQLCLTRLYVLLVLCKQISWVVKWQNKNLKTLSRHPCIPPITPVLYQELFQWNIKGLICRKSQKKSMKSNLGKFLRYCNFNFLQCKNWPIFANFEPFFPCNSIFLIFLIEWMFPKDSQILVHDFRHQNFGIWTFLGWVIALFMKKTRYFAPLQSNLVILPIFFTKMAITQQKKVQIPKFWCLKSCTNIWLPFGNIHSIQKINKIELQGKKGSKFAK